MFAQLSGRAFTRAMSPTRQPSPFNASFAGPLNDVRWQWSFYPATPSPLTVYLCRNGTTDCVAASTPSGSTTAWKNIATSNVPFYLVFRVGGTGTMAAAYGNTDYVTVNNL
jgi:hypothetical protein